MNYKNIMKKYAFIQLFFGILTSSLIGFTTLYLNTKGIASVNIGIFISVCNLFVVGFNRFNEFLNDLFKEKSMIDFVILFSFISIISLALDILVKNKILVLIFLIFPYLYSISIQTSINAISGYMYNKGIKINFGLSKVFCSIAFSLNTVILSSFIEKFNVNSIIISSILSYIFLILIFRNLPKKLFLEDKTYDKNISENKSIEFDFYIFLIAYALLCAFHFMKTTYMVDIIDFNNGNVNDLGKILSLGSISEIPILLLFNKIERKLGSKKLLLLSSLFFLLQSILILMSNNVTIIYISSLFQGAAFGMLIPSGVYYVNERFDISRNEKAQGLLISASSIGTICSTSFAGFIISYFPFKIFLYSGLILCLLVFLIFMLILNRNSVIK